MEGVSYSTFHVFCCVLFSSVHFYHFLIRSLKLCSSDVIFVVEDSACRTFFQAVHVNKLRITCKYSILWSQCKLNS